jgi:transglutaminase-like putative cysteine protease
MRIRIDHRTRYAYDSPAHGLVQALRLSPRDHDGQHVLDWRIDVDVDGSLRAGHDPFGNKLHMFYADGAVDALTVIVTGEVEISDTAGVVRGTRETLPPEVYLRATPLSTADAAIVELAEAARSADALTGLHALMSGIHAAMTFDTGATDAQTTAAEAFAAAHGVCQDYVHIFAAAARHIGVPARYVSGHLLREEAPTQEAAHAWAEALVPDLGWVGFDPTNGICVGDRHVRVAIGLDYLDAAPVRGARRGGGGETLGVSVRAVDAMRQVQG